MFDGQVTSTTKNSRNTVKNDSNLFDLVIEIDNLEKAWKYIFPKSRNSLNPRIREEALDFHSEKKQNIKSIHEKLKSNNFDWSGNIGIPIKKNNQVDIRPLVIPRLEIRIIQRAILEVLKKHDEICEKYLSNPFSYGGIEKKGTPEAIEKIIEHIGEGNTYFIKCDIETFFEKIPFNHVYNELKNILNCDELVSMIKNVTILEVDNIKTNKLKNYAQQFIYEENGIPQGSCLSPLIANIFLHDLDVMMNKKDFKSVRYLDDFIILTKNEDIANKQLHKAIIILEKSGLTLNKEKSKERGYVTQKNINFLGVEIDYRSKLIRPSKNNIKRLKENINEILSNRTNHDLPVSLFSKIELVNNKIIGWGNTFRSICNIWINSTENFWIDNNCFTMVDKKISIIIIKNLIRFIKRNLAKKIKYKEIHIKNIRAILGIKTVSNTFKICHKKNEPMKKKVKLNHIYFYEKNSEFFFTYRNQNGKVKREKLMLQGNSIKIKTRFKNLLAEKKHPKTIINKIIRDTHGLKDIIRTSNLKHKLKEILIND